MNRMMLGALLVSVPGVVLSQPAGPATGQGDVRITVYADQALVEDRRNLNLPAGISRQEFPDVSATIRPETVTLGGAGIDVVEQNFGYDLLSPDSLMRKAEGQTITLLRTNPHNGAETKDSARVLAVNGGVVLETGGHVEILRDDGLPVRVIFDRIPPNLRARPTLSVTLEAEKAGVQPVTLSYLTSGLAWKADYVGLFDEAAGRMDLQGWVTLTNSTGTAFRDAQLTLAAGDLMKLQQSRRRVPNQYGSARPGDGESNEQAVGDLYLYPIAARTTVASNQKKQVSFLDASGVAARRLYRFECDWLCEADEAQAVTSILNFGTGGKGGLGRALPAGIVRVYMRDAGGKTRFVGENRIEHTTAGSDVELPTALAFDVKLRPMVIRRERITSEQWEAAAKYRIIENGAVQTVTVQRQREYYRTQMKFIVSNARPQPVTVALRQTGLQGWREATRITEESITGNQTVSDVREWQVPVPARGTVELNVTYLTAF
ncbi:MAG: DUF4139 domain-containing protein [Alphaproteobacteria bacterium]|nr:DUF4139 domain-containing protein [Alphaproteobacteria bacterium]